ncbi:MAG: 6-hydroxymethylpterin diphosphokinase MptE-like protein [Treponema sp.]
MNNSVYKTILISKNGYPVPVFSNGHTMHSRYDPVKEAEQTASLLNSNCKFFLIAGIGGAYLINAVRQLYPESIILAAENSYEDIEFLKQIPSFLKLNDDKKIIIFPVENTAQTLIRYYLPGAYGSLQIVEQKSWTLENPSGIAEFRKQVDRASKIISSDFSVQAHFGKIWQRNIITNLKKISPPAKIVFPVNKTALVAAAGPSLDSTVSYIINNRDSLYIIATDTAFGSFSKRGIRCDAVISIDGQEISHNHFFSRGSFSPNMLFIFDLCANPAAVRTIQEKGCNVLFVNTGHPLSQYISKYSEQSGTGTFLHLDSGAGTVTIAAADFAKKAGFSRIIAAGADFSYLNGKAYMKGTYLDVLYNKISNRLHPSETIFDKLLFRTPLILYKNYSRRVTTSVLESYDAAFKNWLNFNNISMEEKKSLKFCCTEMGKKSFVSSVKSFDFSSFLRYMQTDISAVDFTSLLPGNLPPVLLSLLPAAAYFRATSAEKNSDFKSLINLAYSEILRYTRTI